MRKQAEKLSLTLSMGYCASNRPKASTVEWNASAGFTMQAVSLSIQSAISSTGDECTDWNPLICTLGLRLNIDRASRHVLLRLLASQTDF